MVTDRELIEQAEEVALLVYGDAERYWSDIDTDTNATEVKKVVNDGD